MSTHLPARRVSANVPVCFGGSTGVRPTKPTSLALVPTSGSLLGASDVFMTTRSCLAFPLFVTTILILPAGLRTCERSGRAAPLHAIGWGPESCDECRDDDEVSPPELAQVARLGRAWRKTVRTIGARCEEPENAREAVPCAARPRRLVVASLASRNTRTVGEHDPRSTTSRRPVPSRVAGPVRSGLVRLYAGRSAWAAHRR